MTQSRFFYSLLMKTLISIALFGGASQLRAQETLVRSLGSGASAGVIDPSADVPEEGPQAVYTGLNGDVYVLDQVNRRILQFDPKKSNELTRSLKLPEDLNPTDLVVANNTIYVWDGGPRALQLNGDGETSTRSLSETRGVGDVDEATLSAFAQTGSLAAPDENEEPTRALPKAKAADRSRQVINSRGRGPVFADVTRLADKHGVSISLKAKDGAALAKFKMQVRSRIASVEVLDIDRAGRAYVLGENVPEDMTDQPAVFVARYEANGVLDGVFELPFNKDVALSRRFVSVSPDGDVYFLRTRKGAVDLLGVGFRPMRNAPVIDLTPYVPPVQINLQDLARMKGAAAAIRPLTRAQAITTALQFASIRWRVTPAAYGPEPDRACSGFNRIRRPGFMHNKLNQEVVGVPYCWGCHGSLAVFAAAVNGGRKAGNVCTRNDPQPDVAGVDCSAFVSACWGLATHFTTMAIPSITNELSNPWDLLPGDALNKPGSHVMLFLRFTPDKRAEVIESSTGGCNGKVCHNIYPLASLLARGYRPVRYRGLLNDRSIPTPVAAIAPQPPPQPAATGTQPPTSGQSAKSAKQPKGGKQDQNRPQAKGKPPAAAPKPTAEKPAKLHKAKGR